MSIQPHCPLCGGDLADDGRVLIDVDGQSVIVGHSTAKLTRSEMTTFVLLWRTKPMTVSRERLLLATSRAGYDDDREIQIVAVMVSKIRRKIEPLGLRISNVWGLGYRIDGPSRAER